MKRLCTICARGGSKGVKNKNIRTLLGKPLIAYSILQAKNSQMFDLVAVSSDSREILEISGRWGADIMIQRPQELATDDAPKIPVIQQAVRNVEQETGYFFEVIVDLDATSPLRNVVDIREVIQLLETHGVANVITAMHSRRSPYFNMVEINKKGNIQLCKPLDHLVACRQDAPTSYDMNASIYAWQRESLLESTFLFHPDTMLYVMPEERSIDIDSELDWEIVSLLMNKKIKGEGK
jgi:CMP-N,N'-diacetyllegionaminic acid synthase